MFSRGGRALAAVLVLGLVLVLGPLATPAGAQEFRGAITGIITDATQAALPGVTVALVNTATKVSTEAVTDTQGRYNFRYLNPGTYTITSHLDGFKTLVQTVDVRVGDVLRVDVRLEVGAVAERIDVVAESPIINTTTAVRGQVIESKQIQELPLADGTAYMLTRLAPGIVDSSDLHFARPGDNGNLAGITANGVQGGNQFSIDGAPNQSNANGVGFSPPTDAVEQFRVQTNAFDAQTGHTAGALVNLAVRSGTNNFHFGGGYFNRDSSRTAMPLLTQRNNGTKPTRTYNRVSGALGGPIVPDKTFFMASFEHLRDVQAEPATYTVPTDKMRNGDLSEFSDVIYDPAQIITGSTRRRFDGNQIPAARIDPVARTYANLYPLPNRPGTAGNYFTNQLRPYDYNALMARVDQNFNGSNRLFVTGYWNKRREDRYNWAQDASNAVDGKINGFAVTQGYDFRSNQGLNVGYTATLTSQFLLDMRVAYARFGEWRQNAGTTSASELGFSSAAQQLMANYDYLPMMTLGTFSTTNSNSTIASLGAQRSDWGTGFNRPMQTYTIAPTLTRLFGPHTVKFGYDFRSQNWNITNPGFPGGRYQFNGAYTRLNNSAATNVPAQVWAQFLLGLPTATTGATATPGTQSSQFEITSQGDFTQKYHHLFVQDDWRVGPKLTVNAGLRLEINTGMSEASNRNLAGFDTTVSSPIEAAAQAAYARAPIPQVPVADFKVPGGVLFANGPVNETKQKLLPRGAASYSLNDKTVVRAGVGLFSYDYFFENINQLGYSQATPVLVTNDNGITYTGATLSNPLPSGQLIQPVGNALGLSTGLGTNLGGTIYQPNRETPYYVRTEVNVQRDLGRRWVAAFTYIYSQGTHLPVAKQVNNIPMSYLSTSRSRDTATETFLTTNVTNPFAGLVPGSTMNGSTVQRQQLLRPFPEFQAFAIEEYTGSDRYHAATIQLDKQFRGGNSLTVQYTRSSLHDRLNFLNPADGQLEDRVSPNDRPNRFSIGSSLQLPFGRGHKYGSDWNKALDAVLGSWQVSGTYQYQTGFPLTFGNSLYYDSACGDPAKLVSHIGERVTQGSITGIAGLDFPAWDTSCFYFHDAAVQTNGVDDPVKQRADQRIQMGNTVRYFPSTLPNVRTANLHLLDLGLSKNFALSKTMRLQFRVEALNALNYTVLWNPNVDPRNALFGVVNQDRNNPRDIQLGLRLTF